MSMWTLAVLLSLSFPAIVYVNDAQRMLSENRPLLVAGPTVLRQDLRRDLELPDIVKQCGPVQQVELAACELELATDQDRVGTDPLRMAARETVVVSERRNDPEQVHCRLAGRARVTCPSHELEPLLQRLGAARPQRDPEPGGNLIRKDQRQSAMWGTAPFHRLVWHAWRAHATTCARAAADAFPGPVRPSLIRGGGTERSGTVRAETVSRLFGRMPNRRRLFSGVGPASATMPVFASPSAGALLEVDGVADGEPG
jgi:hypothetical protein